MNIKGHTSSSARANAHSGVAGGRKTYNPIVETAGAIGDEAVLVSYLHVGRDDAVVFSDDIEEVESVPSLDTESDDEEEEEWESDEEEEDDEEDAELDEGLAERLRILADARALKSLASAFLHPEKSVVTSDPTVYGRNYFNRPSAPETKEDEDADEEAEILADLRALKEAAKAYLHPEVGVSATDPTLFGRNFFSRASAPEMEDVEEAEERARVLAEAAALKKSAVDYLHPEVGVTATEATLFGRNYFNRPSAEETEEDEFADERAEILAEAAALKKSAVEYLHPEVGVTATDATLFGRNYFNRASAPEVEDVEEAEERARVLAEAVALKKSAVEYMHPEVGVTATDASLFGRNYFNRASAPEVEDAEDAEERARVLAEAAALKKSAVDYMHPEVGVSATDATLFGRNYFNRASAPETEEDEFADERAEILAEAAALKQAAVDYMHPEVGVSASDATLFGRNFFNRSSAPNTEDMEEAEEAARVLAEVAALKKSAVDYLHPEVGVAATDATVFGRNYFNRASAPDTEDSEDAEERALVLAEAAALKKSAAAYLHPEVGVTATDAALFGRNYFNRASAPEMEDGEAEERAEILAEAAALKKSAVDYLHPEKPVAVTDATVFGRNYFNRYSAPEVESAPKKESQEVAAVKNLAAAVKGASLPSTKSSKLSSASSSDLSATKKSASQVNLFGLTDQEAF